MEITVRESQAGRQSWSGEFVAQSAQGILPNERLALILDSGQQGTARVSETSFDSRRPEVTTIRFTGTSPLISGSE